MMGVLPTSDRSSEHIIALWNELSLEQKAIQQQETKLDMQRYERELALWMQQRAIPLQNIENTPNLDQTNHIE